MTDIEIITPPYSPTAEESLIGSLLIDPDKLKRLSFEPGDFFIERNRWIFEAMQAVSERGSEIDFITVCGELDARKQLTPMGGRERIMGLISDAALLMGNVDSYAAIVTERARRRRLIRASNELASAAYDLDSDIQAVVSRTMDMLSRAITTTKGATHISAYLDELYKQIEAASDNPRDVYGIETGFPDWDRITNGLQLGEVVKLSGEPGVGKSLLANMVVINAAKKGVPCVIYSLEMSGIALARRGLSSLSKVKTQAMLSGHITDEEWITLTQQIDEMAKLPIFIADCSEMSTMDLRVDLTRLVEQKNIQLVVVDYEALLTDGEGATDEASRSILISKRVHGIIKDLHLACISIGDMTKSGITGFTKGQAAMAGSARMLHDADQIIIMRKDEKDKRMVCCTWEKMREGEGDRFFNLVKQPGYPSFGSAARI